MTSIEQQMTVKSSEMTELSSYLLESDYVSVEIRDGRAIGRSFDLSSESSVASEKTPSNEAKWLELMSSADIELAEKSVFDLSLIPVEIELRTRARNHVLFERRFLWSAAFVSGLDVVDSYSSCSGLPSRPNCGKCISDEFNGWFVLYTFSPHEWPDEDRINGLKEAGEIDEERAFEMMIEAYRQCEIDSGTRPNMPSSSSSE